MTDKTTMIGVREYGEGRPVELHYGYAERPAVVAFNEGGYNSTAVDILDLLAWVKINRPDLLK